MQYKLQIREGILKRLRESRGIPSEDIQARMMEVDRTTLRRVDNGGQPSAAFIVGMHVAFGLGIGEAFEVVPESTLRAAA